MQKKSKDAKSRRDSNASDKFEFTYNYISNAMIVSMWKQTEGQMGKAIRN